MTTTTVPPAPPVPPSKTQLTPYQTKIHTVRGLLDRMRPEIARALPKHLTTDRLLRVALTSITKTPELLECSPQSLASAILQAAQLGLEPDGVLGYAYLVPYKNTATLIPGYKGLLDLARRSGRIHTIEARVVHAKDDFRYAFGLKPVLHHKPHQQEDTGDLIAAYAIATIKDSGPQWDVMWRREIEAIRKRSRAGTSGPWVTDYEEMAKKTVLRRLCKMLPASVELQRAVALDERAESGLPTVELEVLPDAPTVAPLEALADELKAKQAATVGEDPHFFEPKATEPAEE